MNITKIAFCPITGCHLWCGATSSRGYGVVELNGRTMRAHRVAYEEIYGPIPEGLVIDHLCRVRCCVNPDHLRAVTPRENVLADGSESLVAKHASKTRCPKCGGPFSSQPKGRICKPCFAIYSREWKRKKREAAR